MTNRTYRLTEIVGTDGEFNKDEITFQIRNIIVQEFSRVIAQSGIPVLDMAANYDELGEFYAHDRGPDWVERIKFRLNRRPYRVGFIGAAGLSDGCYVVNVNAESCHGGLLSFRWPYGITPNEDVG